MHSRNVNLQSLIYSLVLGSLILPTSLLISGRTHSKRVLNTCRSTKNRMGGSGSVIRTADYQKISNLSTPTTSRTSRKQVLTSQPNNKTTNREFDFTKEKIRGVNLGGWLVLEPWIVPSLFNTGNASIVDEWTFCEGLGRQEATLRLTTHWDTFYTEDDFKLMQSYGLNHVRIPIGYWAFDISAGEPYVQGQYTYMKKAITWAAKYGLQVMIDLHGAPGSQNGFDNSGRRGQVNWAKDPKNVARTEAVIGFLAAEFSKPEYIGVVSSLEALNEPAGFVADNSLTLNTAKQFYRDGYNLVRNQYQSKLLYAVHDAFQPIQNWTYAFPSPQYQNVAVDTHIYTIYTPNDVAMPLTNRVQAYCDMIPRLSGTQAHVNVFVGEFTPSPSDCAPALNGFGTGSRYEGTFGGSSRIGSCDTMTGSSLNFTSEHKEALGRLFEVQTTVYEHTTGWVMWTFKAENADDWSYDAGVKGGWIPKDPTTKTYGQQCH